MDGFAIGGLLVAALGTGIYVGRWQARKSKVAKPEVPNRSTDHAGQKELDEFFADLDSGEPVAPPIQRRANQRVEGQRRSNPPNISPMPANTALSVLNAYGGVLERESGQMVHKIESLPYSKEVIKAAIVTLLKNGPTEEWYERLRVGYVFLGDFLPGVPNSVIDLEREFNDSAKRIKSARTEAARTRAIQSLLRSAPGKAMQEYTDLLSQAASESDRLLKELDQLGFPIRSADNAR